MTASEARDIDVLRFDLLVRWKSVLTPFEHPSLIRLLPEKGYVLSSEIAQQRMPFGGSLEVTGPVATKGNISLSLDAHRPGMSVSGKDPDETMREFDELETILKESLRFDSIKDARFFEVDCQLLMLSTGSPIALLRSLTEGMSMVSEIGDLLKHPLAMRGFRMSSPEGLMQNENWYDIILEPSQRSPEHFFFGVLVFRSRDRSAVWDVAGRALEIFDKSASLVERQS